MKFLWATLAAMLIPLPVLGHGLLEGNGVWAGMAHPLGGWDHLVAMLAVGLVSNHYCKPNESRRALWIFPATFLIALLAGGISGFLQISLPNTELFVLASVCGMGIVILLRSKISILPALALVALFGLAHGSAHGLELPLRANPGMFTIGFMLTSASLHLTGVFLGKVIDDGNYGARLFRAGGVAMAAAGAVALAVSWAS